jgi:hypothetical protein
MLKCYVDDSGSDVRPDGVFVLAGYIMDEKRWEDFAERWHTRLIDEPAVPYCRMSDAEAREGEFADMRLEFREFKVMSLANVIRDTQPTAIACVMSWKDYNEVVDGKVDPRLNSPYAFLFFKILGIVSQLQIKFDEAFKRETGANPFGMQPVDFIFDEQGPIEPKCLQWWAALKERVAEPHRTMISNTPQFKDDRALNPLQAADMLAWHIRRDHQYPDEDRKAVFDRLNPAGVWQYDLEREELENIVYTFNNVIDPNTI